MAKKTKRKTNGGKSVGGSAWLPDTVPSLDLHALTVDQALVQVDEFLHSSFRAGYYRVRVVHGKGTGVLRTEVGRFLSTHLLVVRYRAADVYHGVSGATEVDLADR